MIRNAICTKITHRSKNHIHVSIAHWVHHTDLWYQFAAIAKPWALWRLESLTTLLIVQQLLHVNITSKKTKCPYYRPFVMRIHQSLMVPPSKDHWCWKCTILIEIMQKVIQGEGNKTFFWWPILSLQWRHNEHDGVSNHQLYNCLINRLFRNRWKRSNLRVTCLCEGSSLVTGEFPTQRASNAENVSIWWRHHVTHMHHWTSRN